MSKLSDSQKGFVSLYVFRKQMGRSLLKEVAGNYWSDKNLAQAKLFLENANQHKSKLSLYENRFPQFHEIVEYSLSQVKINRIFEKLGIVKFVGISGSVAANIYKKGDDIDLFIVVANNWSWIYRGIIKLLLTLKGKVARNYSDSDVTNSLCLNFIVEERALSNAKSIFFMHEILHVVPLFNSKYLGQIIKKNPWLSTLIDKSPVYQQQVTMYDITNFILSPILFLINNLAFLLQLFFMILMNHKPEFARLFQNHIKGRIAFYPRKFRAEKEKEYREMYKKLFGRNARNPK